MFGAKDAHSSALNLKEQNCLIPSSRCDRNSSLVKAVLPYPTIWNCFGRRPLRYELKRDGTSFRSVRSPEAPKITIEIGKSLFIRNITTNCFSKFKNIIITNLKDEFAYKYDDSKGFFVTVKKNDVITNMIDYRIYNLNEMYDELVANPNVTSNVIKARDMLQKIAITQFESGYPYLVFVDRANDANPLKEFGRIKMSNLCTEILEYTSPDEVAVCNLASISLPKFVDAKKKKFVDHNVPATSRVKKILAELKFSYKNLRIEDILFFDESYDAIKINSFKSFKILNNDMN